MFITEQEIKDLTSFSGVSGLSSEKIKHYIERADSWIRRATNSPAMELTDNVMTQKDMRIATLLLVEYLWYWDDAETKESAFSHEETVKIGSFSYNKAEPGERTGIQELDSILEHYVYKPYINGFFRVSGPSRK
ncbi:hypothetical protein OCO53_25345 [Peribacillus frigoritolerans]|uniref:hypothetical protein n=1 Tax=Peribacillus frigoritolerans TaxID=450367 RepID=UPI0021CE8510|nr:hypothetical protein [Peribacillus frigoritolerans]MCU6603769.1 hypothetical protein [Peribacillus frigoritolerans]